MRNKATSRAHPNIAFIKYWGNQNHALRVPANGSLSMNLAALHTTTTVMFDATLRADTLTLNGKGLQGSPLSRVTDLLERVRRMARIDTRASVTSENNFPTGSGIASSASAFAALALASSTAAGLSLNEQELSILARTGSGSASRSIPTGFVEWESGSGHQDSFAFSIAAPDHWDLVDLVAVISTEHKSTGSTGGHALADSSPLQAARVADAPRRLGLCRQALLAKDFEVFAEVVELDSNVMHAVMQTSTPPLLYWLPPTVEIIQAVREWRQEGIPACTTIDAGPNVHVLCLAEAAPKVSGWLKAIPGVQQVLVSSPGGPAAIL